MKIKQIVGLLVWCVVFGVATDVSAATEETKLILPDGKPAAKAVVFSVSEKDRPLLMVNGETEFRPSPMDTNGEGLIGADDLPSGSCHLADEDGKVRIDREGQAHLVVAQSGDAMAFVPIGTKGDVTLRECGRLKMDYSAMHKEVLRRAVNVWQTERADGETAPEKINSKNEFEDAIKDVTVIANWKNNLAGCYSMVECEPDEYRLHRWFDIQFVFPDPLAEVAVPPGEVSVGLVTADQVEEMSKFLVENRKVLFNKSLRGICNTSGIHSVSSGEITTPPAFLGVMAKGKMRMQQQYPDWEHNKVFEGDELSAMATGLVNRSPSAADLKDADSYVKFLLGTKGKDRRIRDTNQNVWLKTDGTFLTPPYAIANYNFTFYPSPANQSEANRKRGIRKGYPVEHTDKNPVLLEVAAQPMPDKDIVDLESVSFNFADDSKTSSFAIGPVPKETLRPNVSAPNVSAAPPRSKFNPESVLSEEIVEIPELLQREAAGSEAAILREKVAAAVKANIEVRKRQLLVLEERIKAARERLRQREESIDAIIDRELTKATKDKK